MARMWAVLLLILTALPAPAQGGTPIAGDIGARVANDFARPAVDRFGRAAQNQADAMARLCAGPGEETLENARSAFRALVPAWGKVSVLRFGPLQADNRFERVYFWPDPRGVMLRQVQGLLAEEDPSAIDADTLKEKSVAVQGLPALEYLLFGNGSDALSEGAVHRCEYAHAVAENVAAIATGVGEGWSDGAFHESFVALAPDRDPYRSTAEVAGELVKALSTGLQFIRTAELLPAYGESLDEARGKRAPFWRSDLTFELVSAQVEGLFALMDAAGFLDHGDDLPMGLAASIQFEMRNARDALEQIVEPAERAFEDAGDRDRIGFSMIALEGANHMLGEQFSAAIGLTMGFNALDGD